MPQSLRLMTYLVREYDEAIAWFASALGWKLIDDTTQPDGKRRVVVAPAAGGSGARLLLAKATTPEQSARIGDQARGHFEIARRSCD